MKLTFYPVLGSAPLVLSRKGDVLTVDGVSVDLSTATKTEPLAVDHPAFVGPVTRSRGVLQVGLRLPHSACAPKATRFPEALRVKDDGPVVLPPFTELEEDISV